MMLTETEAKTKWCPFYRDGRNTNRIKPEDMGPAMLCLASGCMAWRWEVIVDPEPGQPASEWVFKQTGRGYCGLAGVV